MSVGQAVALGIAIVAVLSTVAVLALAWRREAGATTGTLDKAARRSKSRRPAFASTAGSAATTVEDATRGAIRDGRPRPQPAASSK